MLGQCDTEAEGGGGAQAQGDPTAAARATRGSHPVFEVSQRHPALPPRALSTVFLETGEGGGSRTAYSSGRGMDLNPELLSAIDRLCVGLVVQCMFQCRVHNLNLSLWI